ncbi:prophage regulatory protein [Collimonas sp. PA-H2]|nr:prophage regulatory protein [Collimonas sp. PA-H2]
MNQRFIRLPEVLGIVGLGKTVVYGKIKEGTFPRQVKLGRISGWVEAEVQAWVNLQIQRSRGNFS